MIYGWRPIIRYDEEFDGLRLWIVNYRVDNTREVVKPIDLTATELKEEHASGSYFPEPTLRFKNDGPQFLQGLVDGLVSCGYKPNEIQAQDKQLEAIKYHLEDMRKLAKGLYK